MKKIFLIIAIAFNVSVHAQARDTTQPKPLVLTGDLQSFQTLLDVVNASNAPHQTVEALKAWIVGQIQKQIPKK